MHADPVGAVVLAAGLSTRLNAPDDTPKQLLPLGDAPVLEHTLRHVLASPVGPVVVVINQRVAAAGLPRSHRRGMQVVVHPRPQQGQASSLQLGLQALLQACPQVAAAVVILGDQPLIPPAVIEALIQCYRSARPRPPAVRPTYRGQGGNPVLLDRALFGEVMSLQGDAGARGILARVRDAVVPCPVDTPAVLYDLDTWDDYLRLCAELGVSPASGGSPAGERHADGRHADGAWASS